MNAIVSRAELYKLVWSEPRTTLAMQFKISDVAIGKHCRRANIPMPPPGYWARKQSGKPVVQPELPLRLPGEKEQVFPGEEKRYGWDSRTENLNEVLSPPVFPDEIELLVAEAARRMGRIPACRDLCNPHPGLKRILEDESHRREVWEKERFSDYYKPYFDAPNFQRQLRFINSILWGFDRIGCKGRGYVVEESFHGIGTLHFLRCGVCIGSTDVGFGFLETTTRKAVKKASRESVMTLRISTYSDGDLDWRDQPGNRLEKQLADIIRTMLDVAERSLRLDATRQYERRVERRQEMLDAIAKERREDEKRRLEAIARHHRANREALRSLANEHQAACHVRNFVHAVREHPECTGANLVTFSEWERKVLEFADSIDPLEQPISNIFSAFKDLPASLKQSVPTSSTA